MYTQFQFQCQLLTVTPSKFPCSISYNTNTLI